MPDSFQVKVDAADSTPDYLIPKLVAGKGIALAILNPAANEQVSISAAFGETNDGNSGAAKTIDLSAGFPNRLLTVSANTTLTLTNPTAGKHYQIRLVENGTGNFTIAFATAILFPGGSAPTWTTTPGAKNLLNLYYTGTEWWGIGTPGMA